MSKENVGVHEASAPALGYLYQVRFALLLALRKLDEVLDPDKSYISIESLDDITFESGNDPIEVLQTKHHAKQGNLTDRSPDLWKTLRIWSGLVAESEADQDFIFSLVTTQKIVQGGLASKLGVESTMRDVPEALQVLSDIASEVSNEANAESYKQFSGLAEWQKTKLLNSIVIIGDSPHIQDVENLLKKKLRMSASAKHVAAFASRLEGLWFQRVINLLASKSDKGIAMEEIVNYIDDLRYQFLPTNLPDDFGNDEPEGIYSDHENYTFVEQLKLVQAPDSVLKLAILNYYRAYEQRSRWSREGLVKPGEIAKYLNILREEWEHINSLVGWKEESAIELYQRCQSDGAIPIRPEFKSAYVARGSYHYLANDLRIGWHPNYEKLLSTNDETQAG